MLALPAVMAHERANFYGLIVAKPLMGAGRTEMGVAFGAARGSGRAPPVALSVLLTEDLSDGVKQEGSEAIMAIVFSTH